MLSDVPAVLRALLAQDPGRPRLTWYGPGGERVELSAKVLDNWVAKTANLLVDELDVGPAGTVAVDLPVHWRAAVWVLATWVCGARLAADPAEADVVVTASPATLSELHGLSGGHGGHGELVAVALPALAPAFGPGLPEGVLDGNAEVRTHGDVFLPYAPPDPSMQASLFGCAATAVEVHGWNDGVRLLVASDVPGPVSDAEATAGWLLAPLTCLGSIVLYDAGLPTGEGFDVERIAVQEGITSRLT